MGSYFRHFYFFKVAAWGDEGVGGRLDEEVGREEQAGQPHALCRLRPCPCGHPDL